MPRRSSTPPLVKAVIGLIAGTVATGPMTVAMILSHRRLPAEERYPLPPREITSKLAAKAGFNAEEDKSATSAATLIAHFGYGAAGGLIYSGLAGQTRLPSTVKGILFGLCVWIGSYLGLLPAAGVLKSATEQPARRNLLMIAVHVVWGSVLGWLFQLFSEESTATKHEAFASPSAPLRDVKGRDPALMA